MHSVLGLATREVAQTHTAPANIGEPAPAGSSPNCSLCASTATIRAFASNGYEWRVCNRCDLFLVYPRSHNHRSHEVLALSKPETALLESHERYRSEVRYYRTNFARIAQECGRATSLLDVGCGMGHLLERFSHRTDLSCLGVEPDALAARFARCVAGCQIIETPFEKLRSSRRFEVVTMINVFPQLRSIDAAFRSLRNVLAPGGKAILCTNELRRIGIGWNQVHRGMPEGFHFLGPRTLDFLCARYGFRSMRRIRIKETNSTLPGSLVGPTRLYATILGRRFSSFFVLEPVESAELSISDRYQHADERPGSFLTLGLSDRQELSAASGRAYELGMTQPHAYAC